MRAMISIGCLLLVVGFALARMAKGPPGLPPMAIVAGGDSKIEEASIRRITSAAELRKVWLEHHGTTYDSIHSPTFEVDMSRCEVVAVFLGKMFNTAGMHVVSVMDDGDVIVVRFIDDGFQTLGRLNDADAEGGARKTTPYAFIVLPKSDKVICVEHDVRQYTRDPPSWKEIARLSAKTASTTKP